MAGSATASGLAAGPYSVFLTDTQGCEGTLMATVGEDCEPDETDETDETVETDETDSSDSDPPGDEGDSGDLDTAETPDDPPPEGCACAGGGPSTAGVGAIALGLVVLRRRRDAARAARTA